MQEQIILTKEELNDIIDSALKRCGHTAPSPETLKMMQTINDALFGEMKEDGKRDGGLIKKTNEMYDMFVVGRSGTIFIKYLVGGIITIGILISALQGLTKFHN